MKIDGTDLRPLVSLAAFVFIAILLLPAIKEISAAKRTVVIEILSVGANTEGGPAIKLIFLALAIVVIASIPAWGILRTVFQELMR